MSRQNAVDSAGRPGPLPLDSIGKWYCQSTCYVLMYVNNTQVSIHYVEQKMSRYMDIDDLGSDSADVLPPLKQPISLQLSGSSEPNTLQIPLNQLHR